MIALIAIAVGICALLLLVTSFAAVRESRLGLVAVITVLVAVWLSWPHVVEGLL